MEREDLELLIARVEEMREYQKKFFARKMQYDLKMSAQKESEVDHLCRQFRRRGYDPDKFKGRETQESMF